MKYWFSWSWPMPHYYFDIFDIEDGHRLVPSSGLDFENDDAAIARAKVIAIGISIDGPAVDPKRYVAVLNGLREEIFKVRRGQAAKLRRSNFPSIRVRPGRSIRIRQVPNGRFDPMAL
jgi:hypothetical protein